MKGLNVDSYATSGFLSSGNAIDTMLFSCAPECVSTRESPHIYHRLHTYLHRPLSPFTHSAWLRNAGEAVVENMMNSTDVELR